jgi:hypothetical protein
MSRVFGVKHTPGHEDLPRKNRMTGRIFFRLYPDLFNLMSAELQRIAGSITEGQEVVGSLYPVLLLLARLYPSSLEGTDSALNVSNDSKPLTLHNHFCTSAHFSAGLCERVHCQPSNAHQGASGKSAGAPCRAATSFDVRSVNQLCTAAF